MANGLIRVWVGFDVDIDVVVAADASLLLLPLMLVVIVVVSGAESGHSVKQTCNSKL